VPAAGPTPEMAPASAPGAAVFDQQASLARVQGDREMLQEIARLFFVETPELLATIRESIARGDSHAQARAAQSVKGTVESFGAQAAREAALRLEVMGRGGDLTQAAPACAELEQEVARLGRALAVFRGEQVR
jgi:HPt (histidine-containing phosphotransfer) domain-containing protein